MIYKNNKTINEWYFNDAELIKVYKNGAICYYKMVLGETPHQEPCFAVVEDITQYSDTEFIDVYDKATDKWYKLNNLDQYEQYGVYGDGRNITYYVGKLTIDEGYEYEWDGSEWDNLGEVSGSTRLPQGYTEVEYVGSNGNAYINTGLQLMNAVGNTFSIEGRVWTEYYVTDDGFGYLMSTESTIRPYPGFCWRWNQHNNSVLEFAAEVGANATLNTVDKGDGTSGFTVSSNGTSLTNNNIPFSLFAGLTGTSSSNSAWRFSKSKYYDELKITKNSQVVADYIPCQRDSDSKYGFYDLVSESFKSSSNSNSLIGGGSVSVYPKYYAEKDEPENNVVFEDMEEALAYECPWVGMRATIDGELYIFDSNNEWSKVPYYYRVEDVTTSAQGGSGWTISGSSTYNPDLSYYDDYSVYQESLSFQYKVAKVTIFGYDNFTYYLRSSGYSSNNFVVATNLDEVQTDPTTMNYNDSRTITNTYNFNKAPASAVNLSNYRRVTYNNLDKTVEHTFYVLFYGRTYSSYQGTATLLIPKDQTQENWEQVTFSSSTNVGSAQKNLYIDGNNSTSGGTGFFYYRWMVGLPSGNHTSYINYSNYNYCPSVTSSTFTSVAGGVRQVDYVYTNTTTKNLQFRLVDGGGNIITTGDTVYYNMSAYNGCGAGLSYTNITFPRAINVTVGGSFIFSNSSNRHYIYGYTPNIQFGNTYYSDNYNTYFDIPYTKLDTEAVTVAYTTYDPNDTETPTFSTVITYPYSGGTESSTTLTSYDVPYTYPYVVSQTNTLFSATTNHQSFTAGQSSRTVTFTLYPNYRVFSTVADMEAYQYAWEGMTAYVDDIGYKYENSEWSEITLPYDAEVQYLETNGTQYINTGAYLNTSNFEIGYTVAGNKGQFGYVHQNVANGAWVMVSNDYAYFGTFENRVNISSYVSSTETTVKYTQSGATINGNTFSKNLALTGRDNLNSYPLVFFAWYDFYRSGLEWDTNSKFKSFYLKNNGTLVVDMIAVRKNGVGYMYDKVSGQLFGNAGTGNFIIGPDVV